MKIEIYQQGTKVTDINLTNEHPVELVLVSNRILISDVVDGNIVKVREGELINRQDDRSRQ